MIHRYFMLFFIVFFISACSSGRVSQPISDSDHTVFKVGTPYSIDGRRYVPQESYNFVETGIASWYGPNFHGKATANGEVFDMYDMTAAHRTLQIPSIVRVTNLENGRSVKLRVNDRGPFKKNRVIDVSMRGAELLGFKGQGTARVKVEIMPLESKIVAAAAKERQRIDVDKAVRLADIQRAGGQNRTQVAQGNLQKQDLVLFPQTTNANRVAGNPNLKEPLAIMPKQQFDQQQGKPVSLIKISELETLNSQAEPFQNMTTIKPVKVQKIGNETVDIMPVPETNLYIQAGAFSNLGNAQRLADRLRVYGNTGLSEIAVNGTKLYRVRIGPLSSTEQADLMLNRVWNEMDLKDARIIVDKKQQSL